MERLTKRNSEGIAVLKQPHECEQCGDRCWSLPDYGDGSPTDRLAEYEDLEEQGKLLKLPCAVGYTIYTNTSMQGWYFRKENRPYKAKVVFIGINGADNFMNVDFGNGRMLQFKFSDIGKTVFLTKSEAEAALQIILKGDESDA